MNQNEMIRRAAKRAGLPVPVVREAWRAVADVIAETVTDGERVSLTNFGTFAPHDYPERDAWNPRTQVHQRAEPLRVVRFKASDALAEVVAGRSDRTTLRKRVSFVPFPRKGDES